MATYKYSQNSSKLGKSLLLCCLLVIVVIAIIIGVRNIQDPKTGTESTHAADNESEPEFVKGELLIKVTRDIKIKNDRKSQEVDLDKNEVDFNDLDEESVPSGIKQLHTKYQIKKVEKVFKDTRGPKEELSKLKQKFAEEIGKGEREINEDDFTAVDLSKIYKIKVAENTPILKIANDLSNGADVVYAEPNYIVHADAFTPNDTYYASQWALNNTAQTGGISDADIDAPEAWDVTKGSSTIIIAVIDTGVDYNHPDLGGCLGATCKVVGGYDYQNNDANPFDDNGHGTHVAGIAAATSNNSKGVAGICQNCKIMAMKFLDQGGNGTDSNAMKSIQYAVANGAKVLSNSYGGAASSQAMQDTINSAVAAGAVFIAAAGNSSSDQPVYPANFENVLNVAATTKNDTKASYSNYGTWIDISAPGGDTASSGCTFPKETAILSTITFGELWTKYGGTTCGIDLGANGKYVGLAGTSMATPHASGVAGLLLSKNPTWKAALVMGQIKYTTDNINSKNPNFVGKLGTGRLNAYNALTAASQPKLMLNKVTMSDVGSTSPNGEVDPGETVSLTVTLKNEWAIANTITSSLTSTDSNVTIVQGASSYPNMDSGDLKLNATPFQIRTSATTPLGRILQFNLQITYKNASGATLSTTVPFSYPVSSEFGWPKKNTNIVPNTGSFADLDLNGKNEVILAGRNVVKAYRADGSLLWRYDVDPLTKELLNGGMAVGNIDADSRPEVVLTTSRGDENGVASLLVLDYKGALKWKKTEVIPVFRNPTLGDLNNDGRLDIVTEVEPASGGTQLRAYTNSGTTLWTKAGYYSVLGDLDRNGTMEVVTTTSSTQVTIYNGANGSTLRTFTFASGGAINRHPVLGDLNADGLLDIIIPTIQTDPTFTARIFAFNSNGVAYPGWPKVMPGSTIEEPIIANINGGRTLEIQTNDWGLYKSHAWGSNGDILAGWPKNTSTVGVVSSSVVGDVDGDNQPDVIFGDVCNLYAYKASGALVAGYPKSMGTNCFIDDVFIGNVEGNTQIGVILYTIYEGNTFSLINTGKPFNLTTMQWPFFLHDQKRTGALPPPTPTPTPAPICANPGAACGPAAGGRTCCTGSCIGDFCSNPL